MSKKTWKYGDTGVIKYSRDTKFPVGTKVKLIGSPGNRGTVSVEKVDKPSSKLTIHISDLED